MSNLDDDIDVQCGVVGALTCEQIANPNDAGVSERLAKARTDLSVMQRKRADEMAAYFEKNRIRPLDEDIAFMREARAIRKRHECEAAYDKPAMQWAEYYNPVHYTREQLGIDESAESKGKKIAFILSGRRF